MLRASPTPITSPSGNEALRFAAAVALLQPQLGFAPLLPTYVPPGLSGQQAVVPPGGSRGAPTTLLQVEWRAVVGGPPAMTLLEGQSGCCLDQVRARATPNVELRPGLGGEFIGEIDPASGGPILWWVESGVYISISSPSLTADELLRVGRSLKRVP